MVPSRGANTATDQSSLPRKSRNGIGSAAAARTTAVPCRSAPGATNQTQSAIAAIAQAMRGSTATPSAVAPAAASGDTDGSGPSVATNP